MEELDVFIFKYIVPIHIMHWPKNIRDKCFTCVGLKMDTISKKYQPVNKSLVLLFLGLLVMMFVPWVEVSKKLFNRSKIP